RSPSVSPKTMRRADEDSRSSTLDLSDQATRNQAGCYSRFVLPESSLTSRLNELGSPRAVNTSQPLRTLFSTGTKFPQFSALTKLSFLSNMSVGSYLKKRGIWG